MPVREGITAVFYIQIHFTYLIEDIRCSHQDYRTSNFNINNFGEIFLRKKKGYSKQYNSVELYYLLHPQIKNLNPFNLWVFESRCISAIMLFQNAFRCE